MIVEAAAALFIILVVAGFGVMFWRPLLWLLAIATPLVIFVLPLLLGR